MGFWGFGLMSLEMYSLKLRGAFLIFLSFQVGLSMLETFFYSAYGKVMSENIISFPLASLIFSPTSEDATYAFLTSYPGWEVLDRVGIKEEVLRDFLGSRSTVLPSSSLEFNNVESGAPIGLYQYASVLAENDKQFADFLLSQNVQPSQFAGAAGWLKKLNKRK